MNSLILTRPGIDHAHLTAGEWLAREAGRLVGRLLDLVVVRARERRKQQAGRLDRTRATVTTLEDLFNADFRRGEND